MDKTKLALIYSSMENNDYSDEIINGQAKSLADDLRSRLTKITDLKMTFMQTIEQTPEEIAKGFKELGINGQENLNNKIEILQKC